jgi:hypothetical protein
VINDLHCNGKSEGARREVLGAGRGVQAGKVETPAITSDEAGSRGRRGAGDGGDGVRLSLNYAYAYAYALLHDSDERV